MNATFFFQFPREYFLDIESLIKVSVETNHFHMIQVISKVKL